MFLENSSSKTRENFQVFPHPCLALTVQSLELFLFCVDIKGVKHFVHVAHHKAWQVVEGKIDSVVCYAILRIVISADFF